MDPRSLSSEQHQILANYFWQRAEGELTSFYAFEHLIADLEALGSKAPLLEIARRCWQDEKKHSEFCRVAALGHGHADATVTPRSTERLRFRGASDEENRVLRLALCCFNETFGCVLLKTTRETMDEGDLHRWNRVHLADEVQHARFGWAFLASLGMPERAIVQEWLPVLFRGLAETAAPRGESDYDDLVPHGYYSPKFLAAAHREAVNEMIVPGLRHLAFSA